MAESSFPKPVTEVISTLADIFRHKNRGEVVELLENAHAYFDEIEFDNWNGGTYTWALRLEIPVSIFAPLESRLSNIEKEISEKLSYFDRLYPNDHLTDISITPITSGASTLGQRLAPSELEVRRFWPEGRFRLFLSHVAEHKTAVKRLKNELDLHGVAAFVAHEDIEPSREWQDEIELGLKSMHALAALITPDFHFSFWTDHEIGWALGRGVLVVPIRLGADPYGLAGKYQGLSGSFDQPAELADSIVKALLANPQTHGEMKRSLVRSFAESNSFIMSRRISWHLIEITDLTDDEILAIQNACNENGQVEGSFGVPDRIYGKFGQPPSLVSKDEEVPF